MFRGHIDFVSRTRVEGWVHSDLVPLAGTRLLAFIDEDCVGEGVVDVFRPDLLAGGIGDGMSGFGFFIQLQDTHDQRILDIRLDGGNALLRQTQSCLVPRVERERRMSRAPPDPECLSWMLRQGWINAGEYALLLRLAQFGVYAQTIDSTLADRSGPVYLQFLRDTAGPLYQVQLQREVRIEQRDQLWEEHLAQLRSHLLTEFPSAAPVVALWAPWTNTVNISEGSHLERLADGASGVDYAIDAERLLWLNLDVAFSIPTGGFSAPVTAFVPHRVSS